MTVTPLLVALGMALLFCGWLVYRAGSGEALRRRDEHALLLELVTRIKAKDAAEIVQADIMRSAAKGEDEMRAAVQATLQAEVSDQTRQGYFGEIALVRAAMVKSGFDPDDDESIRRWNERHGGLS